MAKLVIGCGFLGLRVARRWQAAGEEVFAVTRSPQRARHLAEMGLQPVVADVTKVETLADLPVTDSVLFAVGFDRSIGLSIEEVYVDGLKNVLSRLGQLRRFIYISSTGVFGQSDGGWVNEDSPCEPTRPGGRACLAAEHALADSPMGECSVVLRPAGLYGVGRLPLLRNIQQGKAIAGSGDAWINLIHIDDAAQAVVAAEAFETPSRLYLVSDGQPTTRKAFYGELCELLEIPPAVFQDTNDMARISDKRVSNSRLLKELNIQLEFSSYKAGLRAIVDAMRQS